MQYRISDTSEGCESAGDENYSRKSRGKYRYSDHTAGIEVALGAVALGATVIEKHFTLDKNMACPDHSASLNPDELKMMVKGIRNMEKLWVPIRSFQLRVKSENIAHVRKSIVAAKNIKIGEVLTSENLTTKRPAIGLSPMNWETVVGGVASRDYLVMNLLRVFNLNINTSLG